MNAVSPRQAKDLRPGDVLDGWTLESELGGGGNGSVWLAKRPGTDEAALKVLKDRRFDRWPRFRDEVQVMQDLGDHPGVLPLLAANLPTSRTELAWLATPRATKLTDAIASDSELDVMVAAFASYGATLAALTLRGISHRDIKPENLFRLGKEWVVGDFGLVDYPGKPAVTAPGRRLGPLFFIAPEMLREPDSSDGSLADVFSLAKSLWAVATGQRYPPEGQIGADIPSHQVGSWFQAAPPRSLALTLLLERATHAEPAQRPSMAEFASQLADWPKQPRNTDDSARRELQHRTVDRLAQLLSTSLDPEGDAEAQRYLASVMPKALEAGQEFRRKYQSDATDRVREQREEYFAGDGVKGVLHLCDSPWPGSLTDVDDFARVILARSAAEREAELYRAHQVLLGRPLWWMQIVALGGLLQLVGQEGCEPRATEMTQRQLRRVLLEFPDEEIFAASFRMQRSMIPAVARTVGLAAPLIEQRATAAAEVLSADEKLVWDTSPDNLCRIQVDNLMRQTMRTQTPWNVETLDAAAQDAKQALVRLPRPQIAWFGPAHDPWLESWSEASPLLEFALAVLTRDSSADPMVDRSAELREAVLDAEQGHHLLRPLARRIIERAGLDRWR